MTEQQVLRTVPAGKKFKLLRTGETFTKVGIKKLIGGPHRPGQVVVKKENGAWGQLSSRCHVIVLEDKENEPAR